MATEIRMEGKTGMHVNARKTSGFSLVEVMIVVAIIAILSSIALPAYSDHARKTRRAAGAACAGAAAQQMERFYTTLLAYDASGTPTAAQLGTICDPETLTFYTVGIASAPKTFTVTMTPKGKQLGDSCGNLTINQAGTKTPSTGCW